MATTLASLVVQMEANNAQLLRQLESTNRRLDRFGSRASKSLGTFKRALASAFGAAIGGGLVLATKNALDFADSIDKAAKAANVSTDFLQEMRYAGDLAGVTVQQVDEGFRRFSRRLGEFVNSGAGPAEKALQQLGLRITDAEGKFRGTEQVFEEVVRALEGVSSEAQQSALAAQLFGDDAGPKLALLLKQGTSGIANLKAEAHDLGAVLDEDLIDNAVQAKDDLTRLTRIIGVQLTSAIVEIAPFITQAAQGLANLAREARAAFGEIESLSAQALQRRLDQLYETRQRLKEQLDYAREIAGSNALKDELAGLFVPEPEVIERRLAEIEEKIEQAWGRIGQQNLQRLSAPDLPAVPDLPGFETDQDRSRREAEAKQWREDAERQLRDLVKAEQDAIKASDEHEKALNEAAQTLREQINPMEALETRLAELDELLATNKISWNTYSEAVANAVEESEASLQETTDKTKEISEGALDMGFAFQSAFEDAVISGEKFSDILQGLARDLARIVLRQTITAPLGLAISGGLSGLPFLASGGSFTVGGKTGTDTNLVAFMATRGERVDVTPSGANRSSATTVNVINNTSAQASVNRSTGSNGREIIDVIISTVSGDIARSGAIAQAMQGTFGLKRQGLMRT